MASMTEERQQAPVDAQRIAEAADRLADEMLAVMQDVSGQRKLSQDAEVLNLMGPVGSIARMVRRFALDVRAAAEGASS